MINRDGLDLIKRFEGCELESYKCPAGVLTIGYGHTGEDVHANMVIDRAKAESLLCQDLEHFENEVSSFVSVDLNKNQYAALVSFCYNVGQGGFGRSTLLKKLNRGDYEGAASEFKRWNVAGGVVLRGLSIRRAAERKLFLS